MYVWIFIVLRMFVTLKKWHATSLLLLLLFVVVSAMVRQPERLINVCVPTFNEEISNFRVANYNFSIPFAYFRIVDSFVDKYIHKYFALSLSLLAKCLFTNKLVSFDFLSHAHAEKRERNRHGSCAEQKTRRQNTTKTQQTQNPDRSEWTTDLLLFVQRHSKASTLPF